MIKGICCNLVRKVPKLGARIFCIYICVCVCVRACVFVQKKIKEKNFLPYIPSISLLHGIGALGS